MKAKTIFLSTALAAALATASAAHAAADVKVFSSNACQATFGFQTAGIYTFYGYLQNINAFQTTVVCPIVRDNPTNLGGVKDAGVRVRSPQGTTLSCSLASFTTLGAIVASNTNSTTSTAVTDLPLDIDASTNGGTYSLVCHLPPGGEIYGYRVTEL